MSSIRGSHRWDAWMEKVKSIITRRLEDDRSKNDRINAPAEQVIISWNKIARDKVIEIYIDIVFQVKHSR